MRKTGKRIDPFPKCPAAISGLDEPAGDALPRGGRFRAFPAAVGRLVERTGELSARLEEAGETIRALRAGEAGAIVVSGPQGERVCPLEGVEHPYRVLVETMSEGALTLSADGTILYCNGRFAAMVATPLERVIGSPLAAYFPDASREKLRAFLSRSLGGWTREETALKATGGTILPVLLSTRPLERNGSRGICAVVTDLSEIVVARETLLEKEARFRTSIENMLDAFAIYSSVRDRAGRILDFRLEYINDAGCAARRMRREKMVGKTLRTLFPAHGKSGLFDDYCRLVETGEPFFRESFRIENVEGAKRRKRISDLQATKLGDGFAVAWRDVTERGEAHEALRESEARFRSLVKDSFVGFIIVQGGRTVFMNPEAERIFGDIPRTVGRKDLRRVHPDDRRRFVSLWGRGGRPDREKIPIDVRILPAEKAAEAESVRWAHCRASSVLWKGRKAVLVNTLDVTRVKDLERINLTQEKMAALGRVSAGIAHEIRNPLSGINLHLSALEEVCAGPDGLAGERRARALAMVDVMRSASDRIEGVIRKVLNYSRPTLPRLASVDLNECVGEALELCGTSLRKKGVAVSKALSEALPRCRADASLIGQVLLNLVMNAAQAVEGIEGKRQVAIATAAEGRFVVARIGDSGPGIPRAGREKIFDPFYTTKADGTGLGLTISRRIVHDHGGSISVGESPLGGAEFRIALPVAGK